MTVQELHALAPKAEVFELTKDVPYLIVLDPEQVSMYMVEDLGHALEAIGVRFAFVVGRVGTLKVLELKS